MTNRPEKNRAEWSIKVKGQLSIRGKESCPFTPKTQITVTNQRMDKDGEKSGKSWQTGRKSGLLFGKLCRAVVVIVSWLIFETDRARMTKFGAEHGSAKRK